MNQTEIKALLESRAAKLAVAAIDEKRNENFVELVSFYIAEERYALEMKYVREILRAPEITPLPQCPGYVAGLCNLRGELVLVIDLLYFFDMATAHKSPQKDLIVVGQEDNAFALLVGANGEVLHQELKGLCTTLDLVGTRPELIRGIMPDGMIVIEGEKLLHHESFEIEEK